MAVLVILAVVVEPCGVGEQYNRREPKRQFREPVHDLSVYMYNRMPDLSALAVERR